MTRIGFLLIALLIFVRPTAAATANPICRADLQEAIDLAIVQIEPPPPVYGYATDIISINGSGSLRVEISPSEAQRIEKDIRDTESKLTNLRRQLAERRAKDLKLGKLRSLSQALRAGEGVRIIDCYDHSTDDWQHSK